MKNQSPMCRRRGFRAGTPLNFALIESDQLMYSLLSS